MAQLIREYKANNGGKWLWHFLTKILTR
jgi:hypothetical protein